MAQPLDPDGFSWNDFERMGICWWHQQRLINAVEEMEEEEAWCEAEADDDAAYLRGRRSGEVLRQAQLEAEAVTTILQGLPVTEAGASLRKTSKVALKKLEAFLPTIGRGCSEANEAASNKRREMVHAQGVYHYLCMRPWCGNVDSFQQYTGFNRQEFDEFYDEQGGDRGHLFGESRNHQGDWEEGENKERRRIRGTMADRDRVLCWLMILRKDYSFHLMADLWGPSPSTFERDFQWMTVQATTWAPLSAVS